MAERCPHCNQVKRRTLPQNKRLHALFTEIAAHVKAKDGLYHPAMWWKVMTKAEWLGFDEYQRPDGETVYVLKSTANLDVEELTEFMNQVEKFAAEKGVWLEE